MLSMVCDTFPDNVWSFVDFFSVPVAVYKADDVFTLIPWFLN